MKMNDRVYNLTKQESMICMLIITGMSDQEILDKLVIELSTLRTHIKSIYRKLRLHGFHKREKLINKFLFEKENQNG